MKTIFKKELGDLLPWIVVGMILIAALCWAGASESITESLSIGFAAVAIAFGFLQTIGDMRTDAKGYLMHRPVSVRSIFWGKLLAGWGAYVLTIAVPLIGLALYYSAIGPDQEPVSPWHLVPVVLMSIVTFAFHPATIWTMSRQAKWVGSKAVPLIFAALGCLLAFNILSLYIPQTYVTLAWIGFAASVLVTLWVTVAAAAHAFCEDQFSPTANSNKRFFPVGNLGILAIGVCLVAYIGAIIHSAIVPDNNSYPYTDHELALSADGKLWDFAQTTTSPYGYWDPDIAVAEIDPTDPVNAKKMQPLPANWVERRKAWLPVGNSRRLWKQEFEYATQFRGSGGMYWDIYLHDDRLLVYTNSLRSVLTPNGFYDSLDEAQGAFKNPKFVRSNGIFSNRRVNYNDNTTVGESLISDQNGVYQVDWNARTVRTILNQPNDAVALVLPETNQDAILWVQNGTDVLRFLIEPLDENDSLELADTELVERSGTYRFPEIKTTLASKWLFGSDALDKSLVHGTTESIVVSETADGKTLFYCGFHKPIEETRYQIRTRGDSIDVEGAIVFPVRKPKNEPLALVFPPTATVVIGALAPSMFEFSSMLIGCLLAHVLLAVAVTYWLTRYYELPSFSRNCWLMVAGVLGFGAPLAMWMIYPKLIREACHHCESMRRIDRSRCRQCGADWAKSPPKGNEIIGAASPKKLPASA